MPAKLPDYINSNGYKVGRAMICCRQLASAQEQLQISSGFQQQQLYLNRISAGAIRGRLEGKYAHVIYQLICSNIN
jgi:hypothetical protein